MQDYVNKFHVGIGPGIRDVATLTSDMAKVLGTNLVAVLYTPKDAFRIKMED